MNRFLKIMLLSVGLVSQPAFSETLNLNQEISQIRYRVTAIEHESGDKIKAFEELIERAGNLAIVFPEKAEPLVWQAIALSAQAKHKGMSALSNVKKARKLLEKAISINPSASDGAAYNALAMLYYKVPAWPVAFGNNEKAENYFQQALATSSNIDTNYRYGEFLIEEMGQKEKGLSYLNKALSFPNRSGRPEDALKKEEIKTLISKVKEEK